MYIVNNFLAVFKKYAVFDGRAPRAEYWYFVLANIIISIVLSLFGGLGRLLSTLLSVVLILPGLGVSIRRLHDTNRSGWWTLLSFIPIIGWIILIIFLATDGDAGNNSYGPNPKGAASTPEPMPVPSQASTPPSV